MEERTLHDRFDLSGKVAIITGGASGMGLSVARAFAEYGADTALLDINVDGANEAAEGIRRRYSTDAKAFSCDASSAQSVGEAVALAHEWRGCFDILFNNAGKSFNCPAEDMPLLEWQKVIDLTLTGIFSVAQAVGKHMIRQRSGSIVNTASMSGFVVNRPQSQCGYNAAKAGVIQLTKSLAVEWTQYNVRVNCISPGYMDTPMTKKAPEERRAIWASGTPMRRLGLAEEVQGAVLYLASDAASFTTGCNLVIDGGFSCI